jgi:REP element-mobilizing transposase RayT
MYARHPEPLKAFDDLGFYRYFLTFCTFHRRHLFTNAERVELVRTQILRACTGERMAIIADCYMPDHLPLLVEGHAEVSDCRRFISRAKQFSGFHFQKQFGERLWQRYGYERSLRGDEGSLHAPGKSWTRSS